MKKTLYIAAAVIAVMFAPSCQKDDVQAVKKGMTLSANVEETKAEIERDATGEKVVWHFSWKTGDVVKVTSPSTVTYSFVYDGTSFKCETALPAEGEWTAVYPAAGFTTDGGINFANQEGTMKSALDKYLLIGSCTSDGSATLNMTMEPKCAILKVTNNASSNKNIYLMNGTNQYYNKINSNGDATKGNKDESLLATVTDGSEFYIAIPVPTEKVKVNYSDKKNTSLRKISAGKVYNVTIDD